MNTRFRFGLKTILAVTLLLGMVFYIVRLQLQVVRLTRDLHESQMRAEAQRQERAYLTELTKVMAQEKQELLDQYHELQARHSRRLDKPAPETSDAP